MPEPDLVLPPCHGLIAGWRLAPGAPPESLTAEAVARLAAAGEAGLWLHFDLVDARARGFVQALPGLHPSARAALVEAEEATRIEAAHGALFGCLPDIHYDAAEADAPPIGMLHFALTHRLLVTARRHPLRGVHLALQEPTASDPAEALGSVLHAALLEFHRAIARAGARLVAVEDQMLRDTGRLPRDALVAVRREALRLSRHLDPLSEALDSVTEEVPADLKGMAAPILREERRTRAAARALRGISERGRIAQDQAAARATEETNRRLLVLSVISAAMLPASLVAGIFGMNVGGLPGVEEPSGFAMAMSLIGASVAGVLLALRLGRLL
jgi:zinc transporter